MNAPSSRIVTIPASAEHEGIFAITVRLPWTCIHCGGPRGVPASSLSYDGSRRLHVDGWSNPCGHVETYSQVREWIKANHPSAAA